jgi:hypothetical protein
MNRNFLKITGLSLLFSPVILMTISIPSQATECVARPQTTATLTLAEQGLPSAVQEIIASFMQMKEPVEIDAAAFKVFSLEVKPALTSIDINTLFDAASNRIIDLISSMSSLNEIEAAGQTFQHFYPICWKANKDKAFKIAREHRNKLFPEMTINGFTALLPGMNIIKDIEDGTYTVYCRNDLTVTEIITLFDAASNRITDLIPSLTDMEGIEAAGKVFQHFYPTCWKAYKDKAFKVAREHRNKLFPEMSLNGFTGLLPGMNNIKEIEDETYKVYCRNELTATESITLFTAATDRIASLIAFMEDSKEVSAAGNVFGHFYPSAWKVSDNAARKAALKRIVELRA